MIVLDFTDGSPALFTSFADMERKYSDSKSPPLSPSAVDLPESDSARSTPEAGAEPTGAIPKSRSIGKLNAFRSSLREVGKGGSFKIGRKKQEGSTPGTKEEKKKSKKIKKKDAAATPPSALSPDPSATVGTPDENADLTSLPQSESAESLPTKASKVSKASSLVRKLSIGRYRDRGKALQQGSPSTKALSPASTSPELSPAVSRTDISDVEDAPSVTSSTSESRQGPEGEDGARPPSAGERLPTPSDTASPPLSPPMATQPPPPASELGQSRLIGGSIYKGLADQSETPSSRGTTAAVASYTATASSGVAARQPLESAAPRKDRDPALETVPEDRVDEERSQAISVESELSPPATPAFQSAYTSLDEAAPPHEVLGGLGSSRAATAAYMSQQAGTSTSAVSSAAATKSQILSITTPALKKQQAFEEIRAATAAAANAKSAAASSARPAPAKVPLPDDLEDDQFGDVDDDAPSSPAQAPAMSAPPPSAAVVMAEARARLSQSLGGSTDATAQPVNEKREHLYKILVIGELGTGKTSIIKRYVHQFFSQHYRATIGVDFALKVLNWDANTVIRLQLWDIAGQERFGNMTRVYYKEAVGAFIVFDVTRAATFDAVIKWKQDLDAKVQLADGSPIPCVLLANKCDQQKEGIVNNASRMDEYCREKGFSAWFETSAKENINIEDAARCLVTKILQNDKLIHNDNGKDNDKFALDGKAQKDEKSGGKSCAC